MMPSLPRIWLRRSSSNRNGAAYYHETPLTDAIDAFVKAIAEYIANQVAEKVLLKGRALHRTPAGAESPRTRKTEGCHHRV